MNQTLRDPHLFCVTACSTISTYDQAAYEHVTSANADALALMGKATESYSAHAKEVETLNLTLQKAYEYD